MPVTRGQYRRYCEDNPHDYLSQQSSQSCSECSQSSQGSSQHSDGSFGGGNDNDYEPEGNPNYKENDHCKRHRKEDGSEKTKKVKGYKRRTPLH